MTRPCPTLTELPPPPEGKTGWPWTAESRRLPPVRQDGGEWPRISIVTPSYNQGDYLEATIRSVLLQGYPKLQYVVMDGGSNDESPAIIEKYSAWLSDWDSQADNGQYDAINKGFARTDGEIMAWINSDDMYFAGALWGVGEIFSVAERVKWISGVSAKWDAQGNLGWVNPRRPLSRFLIRNGCFEGRVLGWILQESTFWRRGLWESSGGLDATMHYASDFELWLKFSQEAILYSTRMVLGGFREHAAQKTANLQAYYGEVDRVLSQHSIPRWPRWLARRRWGRLLLMGLVNFKRDRGIVLYYPREMRWEAKG